MNEMQCDTCGVWTPNVQGRWIMEATEYDDGLWICNKCNYGQTTVPAGS